MATARSHTAAKSGKSEKSASPQAVPAHDKTAPKPTSHSDTKTLTVTIPLDGDALATAAQAAMVPVLAAKDLLQRRDAGIPAYIGIAGLAAFGVVEWPVAAVTGAGLAYLRRWGPLRPESAKPPPVKVAVSEPVKASGSQKKDGAND